MYIDPTLSPPGSPVVRHQESISPRQPLSSTVRHQAAIVENQIG
jgi:hypothetical protein